jgi:hypothetical protein
MSNLEKVLAELARYEHPLFNFGAENCANGVQVTIALKPELGLTVHEYRFVISDRELATQKFAWDFERQLFNYLHDYLVEMFTLTPETIR